MHCALAAHLRLNAEPNIVWFHVANETGGIGARRGAMNKRMGVRAGVFDYYFSKRKGTFWLELKAPGEKLSAAQEQFGVAVMNAGHTWACCDNLDEALAVLKRGGWTR